MHPMADMDSWEVLPLLKPFKICLRKKKSEDRVGLADADAQKEPDVEKAGVFSTEGDGDVFELEEGQDAMSRLGYGMVSYFSMLRMFLVYFILLSILYYPILLSY